MRQFLIILSLEKPGKLGDTYASLAVFLCYVAAASQEFPAVMLLHGMPLKGGLV